MSAEALGGARAARAGAGASLLTALTDQLGDLRPSERKVAEVVLADPGRVVESSMAGLAEAAGVSEPTVMRFCTATGHAGFQAFRMRLAQALALGIPVTHSAIEQDDPVAAIAAKVFDHTISSLDRARRSLDPREVTRAVDLVVTARELLFVGLGASGIIAQDAAQQGVLFGVPCAAPADSHQQHMAADTARPGTVVVAISNTGRTTSVLEVVRRAKRAGAAVIGVSGGRTPLLDLADVGVVLRTFEDTDTHTPTVSRLAGLVLVDILATAVAVRRGPAHLERLAAMKESLSHFRGSADDPAGV